MNQRHPILRVTLLLMLALTLAACNIAAGQTAAPPSPSAVASPPGTSEHRIGVRVVNGVGEFYDRVTDERFTPRGMNYVRLGPQPTDDGTTQVYHSVFDPGAYDAAAVGEAFRRMSASGYNTVRVFMSQNTIDAPDGGLSDEYLANMADFITQAEANSLYVMPTIDWLPGGRYGALLSTTCCEQFNSNNANYLPEGGLRGNALFFQDLARGLVAHNAPLSAVLAFELRNEMFYDTNVVPFTLTSGSVTTANGKTYDMSSADEKQRMVDENVVYWIDEVRAAILKVDPTALVSVGFFVPWGPNPARLGDARMVSSYPAIWQSTADFIDLHAYPGYDLNLRQHVENFGMEGMQEKPLIMGEFGADRAQVPSLSRAAQLLVDWQVESCQYGFDGWLFWMWDSVGQGEFYTAIEEDGLIDRALAPATRPDPCSSAGAPPGEVNLARGKTVTASQSAARPAANAVDGTGAEWNSGDFPTQWIMIDLGAPADVALIRLNAFQFNEGETSHEVWVGASSGSLQKVHEFDGFSKEGQLLEFKPATPLQDVRFVRIVTTRSGSWVAWHEIEVIAASAP